MNHANPADFGRLLNLLSDRGVTISFDGDRLRWEAYEEDIDAELLALLRRFKEPLRQALGPDRLPIEEPAGTPARPTAADWGKASVYTALVMTGEQPAPDLEHAVRRSRTMDHDTYTGALEALHADVWIEERGTGNDDPESVWGLVGIPLQEGQR